MNNFRKIGIVVLILSFVFGLAACNNTERTGGDEIYVTVVDAGFGSEWMEAAADMLGYPFTFENIVVTGDRRGRTIGFPTVNQYYPEGLVQPKFGVYESRTVVDGKEYKSFTNLGIRPTWRLEKPMAETHIFDFSGDLYGKTVEVRLIRYLREEKTFASVEALKEQLNYDKSSIV